MFTRRELEELVHSDTQDHPVLSVYIDTDLSRHRKEARRLALKQMLDALGQDAQQDAERVQRFLDQEYDWQSLGVAVFSSTAADFWHVITLAVPVFDYATYEARPNVRLLVSALDEHGSYGIVLVDRDHARFFAVQLGEIAEFEHILPPVPGRQKQGRWMAPRIQRHIEGLAFQNLKQVARLASDFVKSSECSRVLIAGTDDVVAQFKDLLPKALLKQIVGEFAMDIRAPATLVLARAQEYITRIECEEEMKLVETLYSAGKKKHPAAALGLADTCSALLEGSAREVITAADYRAPGFVCSHCGYMAVQKLAKCPLCASEMQHVDAMVDFAIHRALDRGSEVRVVRGTAASRLNEFGSIGALLRF